MLQAFLDSIRAQHLLPTDGRQVLLAVSGGRDSAVMAHLFHRAGIAFAVAHCNFGLRPGDCDRDERFVQQMAARYGAPCHTTAFGTRAFAARHKMSVEEAARHLRYAYFARLCAAEGYPCVAVAHHADDSAETFFLNLLRGTGIAGLHGILPVATLELPTLDDLDGFSPAAPAQTLTVVRPLLGFSRADIDRYAAAHGVEYVDDYTNLQLDARRNQVRHRLMPLLRELNPSADAAIAATISHLRQTELVYRAAVESLRAKAVQPLPEGILVVPTLLPADDTRPTLLFELLRPYGFHAAQAAQLARQPQVGSRFHSPTHTLTVERQGFAVRPAASPAAGMPTLSVTPLPAGTALQSLLPLDKGHIVVDADKVQLPLSLRRWRDADRMQPFGMRGTRLVSDLLKDLKVAAADKRDALVATDASGRIVWLIGHRADDRFRVGPDTRRLLAISLDTPQK